MIPTTNRVKHWVDATPAGFVFHFKAHQIFTHGNTDYGKLPRLIRDDFKHPHGETAKEISLEDIPESVQEQLMFLFNLGLREAHNAKKLGVVVFQFPESFVCDDKNKALILKWRKWLSAEFKMGIELRSESWFFDSADMKGDIPNDTRAPTARFQEVMWR